MSDKFLEESTWKSFAKGRALKDAALLKALAALKKASDGSTEQSSALDLVSREVQALQKAHKADKDIQKQLDDMNKALAGAQKALASQQAARDKKQASTEQDAEDSPALLSTQLLTALKSLITDDTKTLPFLIGLSGARLAVLVPKKTVSPAHKGLIQKHLGSGSTKYLQGECRFEKGALTFMLEKRVGGLAAKISAALLEQTGKKQKVRVRGADPDDVDQSEDDDETTAAAQPPDRAKPEVAATQLMAAFNKLAPQIKARMTSAPESKAALLKAMAEFQAHTKSGDAAKAQATLHDIATQLKAAPQPAKADAASALPREWLAAKAAWNQSIDTVNAQIQVIAKEMRGSGDPDFERIAELGLPALTDNHKTPVMRALFDIEGSQGSQRVQAAEKGLKAVAAFLKHIDTYPLMASLDENAPEAFGVSMSLRADLSHGLRQLARAMATVAGR